MTELKSGHFQPVVASHKLGINRSLYSFVRAGITSGSCLMITAPKTWRRHDTSISRQGRAGRVVCCVFSRHFFGEGIFHDLPPTACRFLDLEPNRAEDKFFGADFVIFFFLVWSDYLSRASNFFMWTLLFFYPVLLLGSLQHVRWSGLGRTLLLPLCGRWNQSCAGYCTITA